MTALREQLTQAVKTGEIADAYEAEDAEKAVTRALEQSQAPQPVAARITEQIDKAAGIVNKAASVAEAAEKFQAVVLKLSPIITVLKSLVSWLY